MQLSVLYYLSVQHAASDGPAGREANFGPVVKRLTDIVWVDASVLARKYRLIFALQLDCPFFGYELTGVSR
jgi:hypothetical protein